VPVVGIVILSPAVVVFHVVINAVAEALELLL